MKGLRILYMVYMCVIFESRRIKATALDRHVSDFSLRLKLLFAELERRYSMSDGIQKANDKMKGASFSNWDEEKRYAGAIINLFTQSADISDAPDKTFYRSLNKELRGGNPEDIWKTSAELLNDALDIVGQETFEHLYRGERCRQDTFYEEEKVTIQSFMSTSMDPAITRYFGGADCFFYHIQGATGVNIQNISVTNHEKEVLIKSSSQFTIERYLQDPVEIFREMEKIHDRNPGFSVTKFNPKIVIILKQETLDSRSAKPYYTATPNAGYSEFNSFVNHNNNNINNNNNGCGSAHKHQFIFIGIHIGFIILNVNRYKQFL